MQQFQNSDKCSAFVVVGAILATAGAAQAQQFVDQTSTRFPTIAE